MRLLSSALLAAQKEASAVPYLRVVISDRIGGVRRLALQRLYQGSEADSYHAAAVPGDGSLLRARVDSGQLYYQRVAAPGPGSDFSAWTGLAPAAQADVALAAAGASVLLFYVDTDGSTILLRESSDYGATLGQPQALATASGSVEWLAAGLKPNGDALLLYSVGATVYALQRSAGGWGSPAAWTNSVASLAGLACYYSRDFNVLVAGTDAGGDAFLWSCVFGDGFAQAAGTWSALSEITRASSGSGVSFRTPFLSQPDTYRLTFVEKYTGTEAYSRPYHSHTPLTADFADGLWREPVPLNLSSEYGMAIAFSGSDVWFSTPSGVWQAPLALPQEDVSADLLELEAEDRPFAGRLRLALRNDDGRYSALPAAIKLGAEVRVSPGYVTASGPSASDGPAYWIEAVEHTSGGGSAALVIHARDAWGLLSAWRARRQYTWAAGERTVFSLLRFLFGRAGLEFASQGGSLTAFSLYPAFTMHPGESGLTAVQRLLAMLPDVVFVQGSIAYLKEPQASDPADYAYGTDHPLHSGRYSALLPPANRAQVFGDGVFAERADWAAVEAFYDTIQQEHDLNITALSDAQDRADAILRQAAIAAAGGEIVVPVNCGQELYDVVEITDPAAGLSAARRRVVGITLRYSAGQRPTYRQRLALAAV